MKVYLTGKKNKQSLSSNTFQKILDGFRVYNIYMKFGYLRSFII